MNGPADAAPTPSRRPLDVQWLGSIPYAEGLALQQELIPRRREGAIPDTLLLLEHPHVITLGTGAHAENVLADAQELQARSIEIHEAGRGGDVTYHGPGQLVGYPILDLKPHRQDLHRYLRDLEEVLLGVVGDFGVEGERAQGFTGVWTPGGKIAAIGVRVSSGWITSHGFALNVQPDLEYFGTIVPCGIHDRAVTSLARETGRSVTLEEVRPHVIRHFMRVFEHTTL